MAWHQALTLRPALHKALRWRRSQLPQRQTQRWLMADSKTRAGPHSAVRCQAVLVFW